MEILYKKFQEQQTEYGGDVTLTDKQELQGKLDTLGDELNRYLAGEYEVRPNNDDHYQEWLSSHKPFHWFIEFYGILKYGGFNVIIGNPPYVEYAKVKKDYTIKGYETEVCGNLYAAMTETNIKLLKDLSRLGIIIPVASVCTDRYLTLQRMLRSSGNLLVSNYNDRPGKLFDGLDHIRLSIILWKKIHSTPNIICTTKYNKWHTIERPHLFQCLTYLEKTDFRDQSIVKLCSKMETSILDKVQSQARSLAFYTQKSGKYRIFYTPKLSGFVQILDFVPSIYDASNGQKREPSLLHSVRFATSHHRDVLLSLLNSNLFFWLVTIYSDCRNLNKREVYSVRVDIEKASPQIVSQLQSLSGDLMDDLRRHSKLVKMAYKSLGQTLTIQCIYPKYSKPIIDEIDGVLAKHYGFTDEELDFIINYDIKYRMGLGSD